MAPAPAAEVLDAAAPAEEVAPQPQAPIPWGLLTHKRLLVATETGATSEGVFLGLENGRAVLEADDGTLVSIPVDDVASVRTIKVVAPAPTAPIAAPRENMSLAFRDEDARLERRRTERMARSTRAAAVAGGVIASLSTVSSVIAEGFNIKRWSLSSHECGQTYYGNAELCGWTDGVDSNEFGYFSYDYYENMLGIAGASTVALPLHIVGGATILVPSALLRNRTGDREGRHRQIAAWVLWGAGLGSLVTNQAVSWTQVANAREVCDPSSPNGRDCVWVTPTRGLPPPFYLITAGLTLSSAILGIIDANQVSRRAERGASHERGRDTTKLRPSPTLSLFPFRLHSGGGLGVAGRF